MIYIFMCFKITVPVAILNEIYVIFEHMIHIILDQTLLLLSGLRNTR